MSPKTPKLGFKVETATGSTTLTIPDRYFLVAVYLWLLNVVLITMAFSHGQPENSGPNFELPSFVVYGGMIVLTVLIILCATNEIKVTRTPQAIILKRFFLGFPRTTQYHLADLRNVRVYGPLRNNKNSRKFQVLFDYGHETITVAKYLSQPTANSVVEKLRG